MLSTKTPNKPPTKFDHHVVLFPTRPATNVLTQSVIPLAAPVAEPSVRGHLGRVGRRTVRDVVVLEVAGRLSDVVHELDLAIQMALAELPRGVVCDLSAVFEGADPAAVQMLATAGRYVRDWAGIPVAVACPDPALRATLAADPLGGHLIVTASLFSAVSMVMVKPTLAVRRLRLAPHPTAPRGSRTFAARTLQEWGLDSLTLSAGLVLSELVTSSTRNATTDIHVSIGLGIRAIRLTVRDNSPVLAHQHANPWNLPGSKPTAAAALSRAYGTLPTADGGKVAWAVINATTPHPLTSPPDPHPVGKPAAVPRTSHVVQVSRFGRGFSGKPFGATVERRGRAF